MTTTTTTTAITYRIKADYGYYTNTFHAPSDGYLMGEPYYDHFAGRESCSPLDFTTVEAAYKYLVGGGYDCHPSDGRSCEYDGAAKFSRGGAYVTAHGQHSRPRYTIVSRKSGRCTKSIMDECDQIAAKKSACLMMERR